MLEWTWKKFDEFSLSEMYEMLKVRQEVFIVEQNCICLDADNLDQKSWHLLGWHYPGEDEQGKEGEKELWVYLRVVFPKFKYKEASIGRVLTVEHARGNGFGKEALERAIVKVKETYSSCEIRISAQQYIESFYSEYGFKTVSDVYDEDGIPHIEMLYSES